MAQNTYIDPSDLPSKVKGLQTTVAVNALSNVAGQTLTVAQTKGILLRSGAAAVSDTTPTAADIIAGMSNAAIGDVVEWTIRNTNSGLLTLVAGSGVTLEGTTTVATNFCRRYAVRVISLTAVTISGLSTAAV